MLRIHYSQLKKLCGLLLLLASQSYAQAQTIVYVDANATGANDGSSWTDAYNQLEDALLSPNAEIWVAAGTYLPGTNKFQPFELQGTQQLYGGFAGTETMRNQRDFVLNPTVLSGDIDMNDSIVPARKPEDIQGNNSEHILRYKATANSDVLLDGFVVSGGTGGSR